MEYTLIRSNRKTLSVQIKPDGSLLVRAPRRMGRKQIEEFLYAKSHWIEKHLASLPDQAQPRLTEPELAALREAARQKITARVSHFAPILGVTYGRITMRTQRTRWGSCSSQGNLNFNCLLMLAPDWVRDYVVVHELCHRKEMNHSARFWEEVGRILPDYAAARKWLKENGAALMARLPE
jgi:predicted metal-dependent hydrolase